MTALPRRPGPYFPRVDALRGIAALLVAGMHVSQSRWGEGGYLFQPLPGIPHPFWDNLTRLLRHGLNGHGAVILFFVISGFVLSLSLDRGPRGIPASARRFFMARVFRLYPAIFATVTAFALLYYAFGAALPGVTPLHYSIASLLRNALLLETTVDGVMWTLQVEVLAAALVFFAFHMRRRFGEGAVIVLGMTFVGLAFSRTWTELINADVKPLQGTFAFLFGMLVPTLGRGFAAPVSRRAAAGITSATVLLFFLARGLFGVRWGMIVEAGAGAAFIALLVYGPPLSVYRTLDLGIVRFFGRISYSFYLFHPVALMVVWKMPDRIGSWIAAGIPPPIITIALWIATSAAIAPLATASYRWVEWPAMKLGRRATGAGVGTPITRKGSARSTSRSIPET